MLKSRDSMSPSSRGSQDVFEEFMMRYEAKVPSHDHSLGGRLDKVIAPWSKDTEHACPDWARLTLDR